MFIGEVYFTRDEMVDNLTRKGYVVDEADCLSDGGDNEKITVEVAYKLDCHYSDNPHNNPLIGYSEKRLRWGVDGQFERLMRDDFKKQLLGMKKKEVATVLIENENGEYLVVSRKDDHSKFGLPGGKREDGDNTILETAKRECYEETGIIIDKDSLVLLYRGDDGVLNTTYDCFCFYAKTYSGSINNNLESGLVKWGSADDLKNGAFGVYNTIVLDLYVKYKNHINKKKSK